jgi:hypothetical protein
MIEVNSEKALLWFNSFWTLDKIDVGQGATNGSSLTTPGLVYLG